MKPFIIFLLVLANCSTLNAQGTKKRVEKLSEVVEELAYFWRLDSNGTNGFRLYTFKRLLNARLDSLDFTCLLTYLGKPNFIKANATTTEYGYVYINPTIIPYNLGLSNAVFFISFYRENQSKYITRRVRDFEEY